MWTDLLELDRANLGMDVPFPCFGDPLDEDVEGDEVVTTTRRGLLRLALVATETGARFAREGMAVDPVTWMLSPRRLFDGRAAVDACLSRDECLRAVLLHGLSLGLDADPSEMDDLAAEEPGHLDGPSEEREAEVVLEQLRTVPRRGERARLWTSLLVERSERGMVQAFDAVVASDRGEAERLLRVRHGVGPGVCVDVVEGFDASLPLVEALVSEAIADMLEQVARDPSSSLAQGLSVSVQQRFSA